MHSGCISVALSETVLSMYTNVFFRFQVNRLLPQNASTAAVTSQRPMPRRRRQGLANILADLTADDLTHLRNVRDGRVRRHTRRRSSTGSNSENEDVTAASGNVASVDASLRDISSSGARRNSVAATGMSGFVTECGDCRDSNVTSSSDVTSSTQDTPYSAQTTRTRRRRRNAVCYTSTQAQDIQSILKPKGS